MAVGRLHRRSHLAQRRGHALHRPRVERFVSRKRELALLSGEDARQKTHERSRVAAVDAAGAQPAQADPAHDELVVGDVLDLGAESAHRVDGGLRVAGPAEAAHAGLPLAERSDQDGPVRDGLVSGHDDVPDDRDGRLHSH